MFKSLCYALALSLFLLVSGCVTRVVNADGTSTVQAVDTDTIKLLATATVAAWAASQKDGISEKDAEATEAVIDSIAEYHADGTPIDVQKFTAAAQAQLPKRYQALAVVLVTIIQSELQKHGLSETVPSALNEASKIIQAVKEGAHIGLAPYLPKQ